MGIINRKRKHSNLRDLQDQYFKLVFTVAVYFIYTYIEQNVDYYRPYLHICTRVTDFFQGHVYIQNLCLDLLQLQFRIGRNS